MVDPLVERRPDKLGVILFLDQLAKQQEAWQSREKRDADSRLLLTYPKHDLPTQPPLDLGKRLICKALQILLAQDTGLA